MYASISGRVTDPSGAVVAGAQVAARHVDTNVTATTATDTEGRFRLPYLKVGPYEIAVRQPGFQDASQLLTLTVGSAFELPITLTVGAVDTSVTVTAAPTVLEAARTQIAAHRLRNGSAQPADERPQLPRRGAARARRRAREHLEHAAVPGNVRRPRRQPLRRQPAQPLEQLHRRRPVGER